MDCSTSGFPVLRYLPEYAQTYVHWVDDTIQSPCPLFLLPSIFPSIRVSSNDSALCIRWPNTGASPSALAFPMNIQGWFLLGLTGLTSLMPKGLSRAFSSTTIQKHQLSFYYFTFALHLARVSSSCGPWLLQTIILSGIILKERKIFLLNCSGKSLRAHSRLARLGPSLLSCMKSDLSSR